MTHILEKVSEQVVREANDRIMGLTVTVTTHGHASSLAKVLKEYEDLSGSEVYVHPFTAQQVSLLEVAKKLFSTPLTREAVETAGMNAMLELRR